MLIPKLCDSMTIAAVMGTEKQIQLTKICPDISIGQLKIVSNLTQNILHNHFGMYPRVLDKKFVSI